ncbi:Branched-chain amino acid aminotransferase/4-amino-4-deoxychorismate lyase [Syntrophobacter sp. SbD1]|nr:Branched-chain amino acid aminotransferase/4-amino-4-deoxychorismate lyase [Syntrophobacter sp. SbD1]
MDTYYIDGEFVSDDKSIISVKDIIVLRSFGVFDLLITYNKRPFHLEDHIKRLENSARCIGLELNHTVSEICEIVRETLSRNPHHQESAIRIVCSGGVSSDGLNPEGWGILMVMVTPRPELPGNWYTDGANVITVDGERFIPAAKSTCYLTAVLAMRRAKKDNAIEAVYVDRNNRILEGTTTNFFCFIKNKLVTSHRNILPGITRSVIIELSKEFFDLQTRDIGISELPDMEEVFITASNKEIVPIVQINGRQIGNGRVGERTSKIMQLFRNYTNAYGEGGPCMALNTCN